MKRKFITIAVVLLGLLGVVAAYHHAAPLLHRDTCNALPTQIIRQADVVAEMERDLKQDKWMMAEEAKGRMFGSYLHRRITKPFPEHIKDLENQLPQERARLAILEAERKECH